MERIFQWLEWVYSNADRLLRGYPSLIVRSALAFDQDDGAVQSRSIAYYALFSIFPLLLVIMSFSTKLLTSEDAQQLVLKLMEVFMPATSDLLQTNLEQVMATRSTIGILALLSLLWSASGVFTAIYRSVNRAWNNPKSQLFWTEKLFGLAVVFILGLLLVATTFYSTITRVLTSWGVQILDNLPFVAARSGGLSDWLANLVPIVVSVVAFIILYRTIPRNGVAWRDVWLGGLIAGIIWELAQRLYTWYLANFAQYSLIYGSVGAIVGFLLWCYLSAMILLVGAEFTAQYSFWRKNGHPIESQPLRTWMQDWSK